MVTRLLTAAAALTLSFDQRAAASRVLNLRHASFPSRTMHTAESSSIASRTLEGVDLTQCYKDMVSVANERGIMTKDAYFYFADIMSNQWFSDNEIFSYSVLPYDLKFAFVTLSCECVNLGGADDCCENHHAHLNVEGADGQEVSQAQTDYLNDICSLTYSTIGSDRINPRPGDMPTTAQPTMPPPTPPPTKKDDPINPPTPPSPTPPLPPSPNPNPNPVEPSGLGPGGIAGISLAGAAALSLIIFLFSGRNDEEKGEERENLEDIEADDRMKVDTNANVDKDAPDGDGGSPDGTKSMTNSVFSAQSTIVTTAAVSAAETAELAGIRDEEKVKDDTDQPYEIPGNLSSLSISSYSQGEYHDYSTTPALPPVKQTEDVDDALDYAIEHGNWEQVAASAAALVEKEM